MQLERLELRNFGPHRRQSIDFRPGINCILGANGSGKSTILDALRFAITNSLEAVGTRGDNITHGETTGHVKALWSHGGRDYTIERKLNSSVQKLTGAAEKLTKQAEIDQFIQEVVGASTTTLLNNVFVPQGKIDAILFQKPTERLKEFQSTFGLERAAQAVTALGKEMGRYDVTHGLEQEIQARQQGLEQAQKRLSELTASFDALNERLDELRPLRDKRNEERTKRALVAALEVLEEDIAALTKQKAKLTTDRRNTEDALQQATTELAKIDRDALETSIQQERDRQRISSELAALNPVSSDQLGELTRQIEQDTAALNDVSAKVTKMEGYITDPSSRPPSEPEVRNKEAADLAKANAERVSLATPPLVEKQRQLTARVAELKKQLESGVCGACQRPFDNFDPAAAQAQVTEAEQVLATFEAQELVPQQQRQKEAQQLAEKELETYNQSVSKAVAAIQSVLAALRAERDTVSQRLAAAQNTSADAKRVHEQAERLKQQLSELPVRQGNVDTVVADAQQLLERARKLDVDVNVHRSNLSSIDGELERVEASITAKQAQADESKGIGDVLSETEMAKLVEAAEAYEVVYAEMVELRSERDHLSNEVNAQEASLHAKQERLRKEARDAEWVKVCRRVQDVLRPSKLPSLIMREFAKAVNLRIEHYLQIWQAPFTLRIDPDDAFNFIANKDGHDMPAARLSCGEKVVVSTSFRFAMADTFASDVGLLVLDEPSAYLDKENISHLQDLLMKLKELANDTGRQIILVTHEESLLGFVDHAIRIKGGDVAA